MIRRARYILAAAGTTAILAGGMTLAGAGAASAATLPSCATGVNCNYNYAGAAGYNGADDNHTHYRYVQTYTTAAPGLINLDGQNPVDGANTGTTGLSLCDENTGQVAQLSLGYYHHHGVLGYHLAYGVGHYKLGAADPCVQSAGLARINLFQRGHLLQFTGIGQGDKLFLSITYNSGTNPSVTFSACDLPAPLFTNGVCRSGTVNTREKAFTEFGIGAVSQNPGLTAVIPGNGVAAFSSNKVACYSCANEVPITSVSPVNPFNIGGLYESELWNISQDPILSPLDSLAVSTDTFGISSGSYISKV